MQKRLTESDIKKLRYQCRMGYILPFFLFILGSFLGIVIVGFILSLMNMDLAENKAFIVIALFGLLSVFVNYRMNGKYLSDIRNGLKGQEIKIVQRKEYKTDYEAGSGTLYIGQEMNSFDSYSIIVENTRYRVDKDLFENCEENGQVIFNYAVQSKFLLEIEY